MKDNPADSSRQLNGRPTEVLVTGGRGKTGREVVRLLGDAGVLVRAGSTVPGIDGGTVRPVLFDWQDPATWTGAVVGVDAIYLMRPDLPDAPERVLELVRSAPDAHITLLSEQGAGTLAVSSWERQVEAAVTAEASTWTVLRPSWFHQVLDDPRFYLTAIRDEGILPISSAGGTIAFVDARDIAEVAVMTLLDREQAAGKIVPVTGPEALSVADAAALISIATGRAVHAVDPPRHDALAGLDPWFTTIFGGVLDRVRDGVFSEVTDDVTRLTGRSPRSLAAFVHEQESVWRPANPHFNTSPPKVRHLTGEK